MGTNAISETHKQVKGQTHTHSHTDRGKRCRLPQEDKRTVTHMRFQVLSYTYRSLPKSAQLFRIHETIKTQEEPLSTQMRTYLCWKHWEILLSLLLEPQPLRCIVLHPEALSDHILLERHRDISRSE